MSGNTHSVVTEIEYDDNTEYVRIELKISTKMILTNYGVQKLHDMYFDGVKQALEDVKELKEDV